MLNIGEEECKGTGLEKEAHKILEEKEPLFIGNIEANEVFTGKTDCIVCDGYVGNITLKVAEGLIESVGKLLKREIKKNPIAILGAILLKSSLSEAKKSVDYSEYGGAPLLGVDGLVLISHGRSSPKAIKNAIRCCQRSRLSIMFLRRSRKRWSKMVKVGILGLGAYLPSKKLTNFDLEKMVETSDEWIRTRTGIKERRIAALHEKTSDLASKAAVEALKDAKISAEKIDLIVVATISPDSNFPSVACKVQKAIGAKKAAAFDVSAACAGYLYALTTAKQYIQTGIGQVVPW